MKNPTITEMGCKQVPPKGHPDIVLKKVSQKVGKGIEFILHNYILNVMKGSKNFQGFYVGKYWKHEPPAFVKRGVSA